MLTRRAFLKSLGLASFGAVALGAYAFAIEPGFRLNVTRYRVSPPGWPEGLKLRIVALADIHACEPWMSAARIRRIVARANALEPDVAVLLGDYSTGMALRTGDVHSADWAPALGGLVARHGVFGVLGNHDWWSDFTAQRTGAGLPYGWRALEAAGVRMLENDAARIEHDGRGVWIAGLGDQLAYLPSSCVGRRGRDDLPKTVAALGDGGEPAILLAHEPDVFPRTPDRFALTLSGHTHGGQVRLFGRAPVVPSRYGERYSYGHVVEEDRHLIVSGGLGCSIAPVRFGAPPEIVVVDLGDAPRSRARRA
ncbi:MAG: metallophosphoesterase [Pseudomonadota bacterium]